MKSVRNIAVFPLFLASLLMTALAVLPHHHHGEMICFNNSHCQKNGTYAATYPHHDDAKSLGHHHDPEHHCGLNASMVTEDAKSNSYTVGSVIPEFSAILSCIPQLPRLNNSEHFVAEMEDYLKNPPFIENPILSFVAEVRVLRDVPLSA